MPSAQNLSQNGNFMRILFFLTLCFCLPPAFAGKYNLDIQRAERSCQLQQNSLLRDREGTPACDRLEQLYQQKEDHERDKKFDRIMDSANQPKKIIIEHRHSYDAPSVPDSRGEGYYWNNREQRYCHHNSAGYPVTCY